MILCTSQGMWFYSIGINRAKHICWVRVGPHMPRPEGFEPLPPIGALYDGPLPWPGDIRFFPELRYRGCRVTPVSWHATATEPLLLVHMTQEDLDFSKYFVKPPNRTGHEIKRAMEADGWSWDLREDGYRYLHVDELEMFEGPPPEGPF